ncbi:MAG: hypothetical protein SOZ07_07030 [Prevotella sp.]|nr:hypothetical protein [Prevotella sp.]MDD7273798.1 hypothetical protein [Prevotellaceae bacterium]MDY3936392.1 hypothetical protein [Prevotella sp.]MDY4218001.1 hypothetical protein [Prevotella sp.]
MEHQVLIWTMVVILLSVFFILHDAIHSRKEVGNKKLFEISDEFSVYDWEDESD